MFASAPKTRVILFAVVLLLLFVAMFLFSRAPEPKYNEKSGTGGRQYVKAKVLRVLKEELEKDSGRGNTYQGYQDIEVRILSGEHKGEVHTVTNNVSVYLNVIAKPGQTLIANIDSAGKDFYLVTVYSYYRAPILLAMFLIFFGLLWWVGGKKGLKSVLGILFTLACIVYLFIPMLYRGYSPLLASLLIVVLTTCVTLLLLNGWTPKSLAAILGTISGVALSGILAYAFGQWAHITGYNTAEVEVLVVVADQTGLQLGGMLFAGIMLSSLGAIIDVGISIAAAVQEVYETNPNLSRRELYRSGINVGRDMMGTMANTLILALTGTTLASLMILYAVKVPFSQLTNMNMMTVEIVQGLTGCIGVVLTVPIVAFISARVIPESGKNLVLAAEPESKSA
ncbi:YibE/F family protein [Cohnella sp. REN36]|uniref:YibE/F family protein n=1 Tax=Cohnella sp. REN36 TaxID=2887347 RepID=UPI001D14CBDD|nr:YibE/F family protein [Cohnella sp. REN36]MCC3371938.1 YibE/F family protein [Cohnella sp. REN36]